MSEHVRAHVLVSGRVQGVNFRARTRDHARSAGVTGWVANRDDGMVEAVFEGPRPAVERVVSWCYSASAPARVDHVEVRWEQPQHDESSFSIVW